MSVANPHLHGADAAGPERRLKRRATLASCGVALVLVAAKLFAYITTDSVSMLSSLLDSAFDGLASLVAMLSVAHAAIPADADHRFGHGKAEALSALAQTLFIFGSAAFLLFEAVHRFIHPVPVSAPAVGAWVSVFAMILTIALVLYQRRVIRKTGSVAISADSLHYTGDLLVNGGVLAALWLGAWTGRTFIDPLFAVGVAGVLLYGARAISVQSLDILMDRELEAGDRDRIIAIASAHPAVRAVHDLRTRSAGARVFIEFHMELDGNMTLSAAHDISEEVEKRLFDAFPTAEVLIHQEPAGIADHRIDDMVSA